MFVHFSKQIIVEPVVWKQALLRQTVAEGVASSFLSFEILEDFYLDSFPQLGPAPL